ncbi:MAG: gamma carbonic anhydrase family protein [Lachnospiraceae bacterium]|nr:gamma carbonic anhydrase family protein [Lachnospiraceae bacterium]
MVKAVIHPHTWIAEDAVVKGDVKIEEEVSIWYHAVVRGASKKEHNGTIHIGKRTNIQDGCVLHVDVDTPIEIGEGVTVGHKAMLHGCSIGNDTLIGMGSIILNGAQIGNHCMIGAGSLVTQNTVIPDGYLAFGSPAKPVRPLTEEEIAHNRESADYYTEEAKEFYNICDI